jgi:two-component system, LytTR family, sensor kinase
MKKKNIILIHILYWFYIINQSLFPMYIGKIEDSQIIGGQYLNDVAISLFLNVLSFYAIYFAFPRIAAMKNKILVFVAAVIMIFIIMGVRLPIDWCFWKYIGHLPEKEMVFQWVWVWNELRLVVITGIYAILIRFMINAFETQKLRDELINQRQAGELALLKSQVNPHFLFNTLNNIYSLVYNKSDEAPEAVMKFSSIMRYVLYDASAESVLLEKEIEYLRSFIELQKLRFKQPEFVLLNIDGNTDGITIAPMLLIPFVENAFKHGSKNHQPGITIHLHIENHLIRFEVSNYIRNNQQTTEKQFGVLGLSNLRRRLDLIYPGKYNLVIKEENDQFFVNLLIEL